jgi:NADPH2:quinone reductase
MDFVTASAFLLTYGTSHHALKDRAQLRAGETMLVLGAAGGVGLAAVELGRELGARVIAAASSEEKRTLCSAKGARVALDSAPEGFRERIREAAPRRVDAVIDPVGGAATEPAVRALAHGGRHVVVGFAAGEIPRIATNLLLLRNARLVGFEIAGWMRGEPEAARVARETLHAWLASGRIAPHVGGRFPLERVAEALRLVAERRALGKLIVEL